MSEYRERLDEEMWERLLDEEYAPARTELDEVPLHERFVVAEPVGVRRGTYDELREMKINEKTCPLPGCTGQMDEDFFCSMCGNVSLPKALREAKDERRAA